MKILNVCENMDYKLKYLEKQEEIEMLKKEIFQLKENECQLKHYIGILQGFVSAVEIIFNGKLTKQIETFKDFKLGVDI